MYVFHFYLKTKDSEFLIAHIRPEPTHLLLMMVQVDRIDIIPDLCLIRSGHLLIDGPDPLLIL